MNGLNERAIALLSYILVLAVTYAVAELAWWVVNPVVGAGALITLSRAELLLRTVSISAVVAALVLRYFYVQFHWKQRIASEAQAHLEALQARIRPHFFFNCLNSIASLTRSDPKLAERAVEDLADLFRASFADAQALVPFAEELALVEGYLSIERLRLGDRLKLDWQLETLPTSARLPLLSLQPIIENAIYHGIEPAREGGTITIAAKASARRLSIDVSNPVSEQPGEHHHGNQIALENVGQRLRAHFGSAAVFTSETVAGHYHVHLELPLEAQARS